MQNHIFHVIKININIYKITTVKTKSEFKIKQKLKAKNDNIIEFKLSKCIYNMMKI